MCLPRSTSSILTKTIVKNEMARIFALVEFRSWVASQCAILIIVELNIVWRLTVQKTSSFSETPAHRQVRIAPVRFSIQFSLQRKVPIVHHTPIEFVRCEIVSGLLAKF